MRNSHGRTWNMARTTEKRGKWNTNTVRPGICPKETDKVKMRNSHGNAWNMAKNTEKRAK